MVVTATLLLMLMSLRSVHTLEQLGITNIVCLCSDEIGQLDSQYLNLFQYKNFSIDDKEYADIGSIINKKEFHSLGGMEIAEEGSSSGTTKLLELDKKIHERLS